MKKLIIVTIAALVVVSCKQVFETNITQKVVNINAPNDNATLTSSSVTFWWEQVDGALKYNIQIAKPSFTNVQTLLLDSNVTVDKFNYSLGPGSYQWRIKATNGSSSTAWFTRSFSVDSSLNLATSSVQLATPANGSSSNTFTVALSWLPLTNATSYNLQVQNQTNGNTNTISGIYNTTYSYPFTAYGTYKWRVWAENANTQSQYSNWNTINITIPSPSQSTPADRDSSTSPVSFSWTWAAAVTPVGDSIYIYGDSTGTTIVKADYSTTKTYSYATSTKKWYSWKIRTVDNAGNISGYSALRKFKVK